jgi:hypothetical protein
MMAPPKKLSYKRASGLKNLGAVIQKTFSTASTQSGHDWPSKLDV